MTTPRVANSSVLSMPLKDLAESAAVPSGPVMWTDRPCPFACVTPRMASAAVPAAFQPFLPRLTGTTVWIAWPSLAKNGPDTWPRTTPEMAANRLASAPALARSAAVSPAGRSYTTTAGNTLGDWNCDSRASTLVDSALAGSHACASFFSAPISLPASGPAAARMMIHRTRTAHLVRRPAGMLTIARALLIRNPPRLGGSAGGAGRGKAPCRSDASRPGNSSVRHRTGRSATRYISLGPIHKIYLVNGL